MQRRRNGLFAPTRILSSGRCLTALRAVASVSLDMLRLFAVVIGVLCLTGCPSGPPVQELSDARQAIAAATTAGLSPSSSPDLYAAEAAISRAESHLEAREYVRARLAAQAAKRHATEALANAPSPPGTAASTPRQ